MRLTKRQTILTEKGKVQTEVREAVAKIVSNDLSIITKAKKVGKNKYELPVHNADNTQTCYLRFEISVSEKSFKDLTPKKSKATASADIDIDIE